MQINTRKTTFLAVILGSFISGIFFSNVLSINEAHASRNDFVKTGELNVPQAGSYPMVRFEDPEYNIVCYQIEGALPFSCTKK